MKHLKFCNEKIVALVYLFCKHSAHNSIGTCCFFDEKLKFFFLYLAFSLPLARYYLTLCVISSNTATCKCPLSRIFSFNFLSFSIIIFLFIFFACFLCCLIQFVCAACHSCSFAEPLFQRNCTSFCCCCVVSFLFSWLHASMSFNKFFSSIKINFRRVLFSSFYPCRCSPTVPFSMSEPHCYFFVAPFNNFCFLKNRMQFLSCLLRAFFLAYR